MISYSNIICLWVALTCLLSSSRAMAYRGQSSTAFDPPPETPVSGLPGYFDASVAQSGVAVMELPTMSLDFGVTDRFTLGTNGVPFAIMAMESAPAFALKARYLLYSSSKVASSLTLYGGGAWLGNQQDLNYSAITNNTSYFFDPYTNLTFHLSAWRVHANGLDLNGEKSGRLSSSQTGILLLPGVGFQKFFTESFGFETQVLYLAVKNLQFDTTTSSGVANILQDSWIFPWRALLNFKTSSSALLSAGLMGFYSYERPYAQIEILPYLTFTWMSL